MNDTTHAGSTISIKGEVTSQEPLTISGHVDGSVEVVGHALTIAEGARATATLLATTILVSGTVKGSLCATDRMVVNASATIEGDLTAPSLSLTDGAKVQGRIDTGGRKAEKLARAS